MFRYYEAGITDALAARSLVIKSLTRKHSSCFQSLAMDKSMLNAIA